LSIGWIFAKIKRKQSARNGNHNHFSNQWFTISAKFVWIVAKHLPYISRLQITYNCLAKMLLKLIKMVSLTAICSLFFQGASGQAKNDSLVGYLVLKMVVDRDTLPYIPLKPIYIFPPYKFKNQADFRRYQKLIYNIKKVYPYSLLAKQKLYEMNTNFLKLKTEREKKVYVNQVEDEMKKEFEAPLRHLTISQGKLLVKLIDRETGQTTYELVRQIKGPFNAFFWQAMARMVGSNLKTKFDKDGDDKMVDRLILLMESGQL